MDEKKFQLLIGGFVIVALLLIGILLIFGLFGLWRRHNQQNSSRATRGINGGEPPPDPWETAGKRLNVKDESDDDKNKDA